MLTTVDECKQRAHDLIDELYDALAKGGGLTPGRKVGIKKREYAITVQGNYDTIAFMVADRDSAHVINYYASIPTIELKSPQGCLHQQTLKRGGANFHLLSRILDDIVILLERWMELKTPTVPEEEVVV